jgi:hypothetical protein
MKVFDFFPSIYLATTTLPTLARTLISWRNFNLQEFRITLVILLADNYAMACNIVDKNVLCENAIAVSPSHNFCVLC